MHWTVQHLQIYRLQSEHELDQHRMSSLISAVPCLGYSDLLLVFLVVVDTLDVLAPEVLWDVLEDVDGCVGRVLCVCVQLEARHGVHPFAVDEGGRTHVHRHGGHSGVWGAAVNTVIVFSQF